MEVHQHSHTQRKKWSHYFWEFLMLFLAVFAGFMAENQREHMVEHQRAKDYAFNLYEELKLDTQSLTKIIKDNYEVVGKLDTFCLYIREKTERKVNNGMLYYYSSYATAVYNFTSNNTTIEQLKGSGNLRIMGNEVSQKISDYGRRLHELEFEYLLSRSEFEKIEELNFKIFDGFIKTQLFNPSIRKQSRDTAYKINPPLINNDTLLMKEFVGWLKFEARIYFQQNENLLKPLKQSAIELLALLKKEYHFE